MHSHAERGNEKILAQAEQRQARFALPVPHEKAIQPGMPGWMTYKLESTV
jgi:hypothetical protein